MHHSKGWGGSQLLPEVKIQSHSHEIAAWEGLGGGILQEFSGCGHKSEWREQNKMGQIQELPALTSLKDSQLKDNWFMIKSCSLMNPKHRAILTPAHPQNYHFTIPKPSPFTWPRGFLDRFPVQSNPTVVRPGAQEQSLSCPKPRFYKPLKEFAIIWDQECSRDHKGKSSRR